MSWRSTVATSSRATPTAHVDDENWKVFRPAMVGIGWDLGLLGLGRHLGPGQGLAPEAATMR